MVRSLALRRLGEAASDIKVLAGHVAAKAEGSKSLRLPARRWRLEGSRVGNSGLVNEKRGHELRRQFGGELVETIEAREAYSKHFACEVPCPKKSCKAEVGKCCITSDGKPTVVHKKRAEAWSMKDVVVDPTAPNATKPVKPIDRDCPRCKQPAGARCRNTWGGPASYHEARRADAKAATAAAGAAAPAVVEAPPPSPPLPATEAERFVAAATAPPPPLDVACPDKQCRAPKGSHCHSLGKKVATHKVRVYAADPAQAPEVKREPSLHVACPKCHSPRFVRCVTHVNKFTKPHAERVAAAPSSPS